MKGIYQYRHAAITDTSFSGYGLVKDKAFPILNFKVRDNKIKAVDLLLSESPLITQWFTWKQVMLFKGPSDWQKIGHKKRDRAILNKLLRHQKGVI